MTHEGLMTDTAIKIVQWMSGPMELVVKEGSCL